MKAEYNLKDFKRVEKNPFYHKLNKEVTVPLRYEVYEVYEEIAKQNDEPPEKLMRRCLTAYVDTL
ncbi:MAG: hypothetical protein FWG45_01790 [Oscillospiraceae bacterium]|nr:hypothetical protein [Oscillospiraceae bacterium]